MAAADLVPAPSAATGAALGLSVVGRVVVVVVGRCQSRLRGGGGGGRKARPSPAAAAAVPGALRVLVRVLGDGGELAGRGTVDGRDGRRASCRGRRRRAPLWGPSGDAACCLLGEAPTLSLGLSAPVSSLSCAAQQQRGPRRSLLRGSLGVSRGPPGGGGRRRATTRGRDCWAARTPPRDALAVGRRRRAAVAPRLLRLRSLRPAGPCSAIRLSVSARTMAKRASLSCRRSVASLLWKGEGGRGGARCQACTPGGRVTRGTSRVPHLHVLVSSSAALRRRCCLEPARPLFSASAARRPRRQRPKEGGGGGRPKPKRALARHRRRRGAAAAQRRGGGGVGCRGWATRGRRGAQSRCAGRRGWGARVAAGAREGPWQRERSPRSGGARRSGRGRRRRRRGPLPLRATAAAAPCSRRASSPGGRARGPWRSYSGLPRLALQQGRAPGGMAYASGSSRRLPPPAGAGAVAAAAAAPRCCCCCCCSC